METIVTRDTDILREYLAVLDSRERGVSPFARLAATVKLARLRKELGSVRLEATDEDFRELSREIDERLGRTLPRRFEARPWGARASVFLMLVLGQQLVLLVMLVLAALIGRFAPVPSWWNSLLPHDEPSLLYIFIFLFFFVTPMLALLVLYGGRFFSSWRRTVPATLVLIALSALGTYLSVRAKPNPVLRQSSLAQFSKERGMNLHTYRDWVDANWLLKDARFQRDYETFLRNGPGRLVTSSFDSKEDAAWKDALPSMNDYLDGGQDPKDFGEWLKDYMGRFRIHSEDRIDQEVAGLTNEGNQRYLGIWEVEPFLKERDERMYRAYLGSINHSMKKWGLAALGLFAVALLGVALAGRALSLWERAGIFGGLRRGRGRGIASDASHGLGGVTDPAPLRSTGYSFPEQHEITTPPFFDTPFRMLARAHRSFVGLAVSTSIFVFAFWAVVYAVAMASGQENVPSQVALMRSYLLVGGRDQARPALDVADMQSQDAAAASSVAQQNSDNGATGGLFADRTGSASGQTTTEAGLATRVSELEQRLDDTDYDTSKKLKDQGKIIASQLTEIDFLKNLASQLQQTTTPLPQQVADLTSRTGTVEERAGQALGDASAAKQSADSIDKKLTTKLGEVDARATHASEGISKVEDRTSTLSTRTEALEKELDRRARQIEARTEELGDRTVALKEREDRADRIERAAVGAILSEIKAQIDGLDTRSRSAFYRFFNKGEARRDAESIKQRITQLSADIGQMKTDEAKAWTGQLSELEKRVEEIAARVK
ncbi:MAG TPA: hypothetical protein VN345_06685 [Blastocatellia bacterium]|nr:hypothetical protein [Blastocatellia bacterium]